MEAIVRQRLDHIAPLVELRNGKRSYSEALLVQCEIQRQLLLADWSLLLEFRRIGEQLPDMPMEHCGTLGKRMQVLGQLKQLVEEMRRNVKATNDDLKRMPIYSEPRSYFPQYWNLPGPVVRQNALRFLTEPQDKLNLVRAFPCEGELMKWNEIALDFDVTFSKKLSEGTLSWRKTATIDLLRGATTHFQRSLNQKFEEYLVNDLEYLRKQEYGNVEFSLFDLTAPAVTEGNLNHVPNPFTGPVIVDLGGTEQQVEAKLGTLAQVGAQIWDMVIEVWATMTAHQMLERIGNCLRHTPNVRKLLIFEDWEDDDPWEIEEGVPEEIPVDQGLRNEWIRLRNVQLPECPFLKSMRFELNSRAHSLVRRKLLENYGKQINRLAVSSVSQVRDFQYQLTSPCTLLSTLIVTSPSTDGVAYPLRMLNRFVGSPLSVVDLQLDLLADAPQGFGQVLVCLSGHYGKYLKELSLFVKKYNGMSNLMEQRPPAFPVLRTLKLHSTNQMANGHDHQIQILLWLQTAPLKALNLKIAKTSRNQFPGIMSFLSSHFGETLEQLTLDVNYHTAANQPLKLLPIFMTELTFPKLKTFSINVDPHPSGWEFLLLFPALEQLVFTSVRNLGGQAYAKEKLVEITSNLREMHTSCIWKVLPRLKEISLEYAARKVGKLTRHECIEFVNSKLKSAEPSLIIQ